MDGIRLGMFRLWGGMFTGEAFCSVFFFLERSRRILIPWDLAMAFRVWDFRRQEEGLVRAWLLGRWWMFVVWNSRGIVWWEVGADCRIRLTAPGRLCSTLVCTTLKNLILHFTFRIFVR